MCTQCTYITTTSGFPEGYERTSVCSEQQLLLVLPTGDCIFSTNEICRFLCCECGQDKLCGDSPEEQALIDHWLGWEASELKVTCISDSLHLQPYGVNVVDTNHKHCYCNTTYLHVFEKAIWLDSTQECIIQPVLLSHPLNRSFSVHILMSYRLLACF